MDKCCKITKVNNKCLNLDNKKMINLNNDN